ncbi:hypothetical protein [Sediminibacillus sp. JSM 1682029]|uniref:hypothetical protein n=1 Tax=Sediminibacillus sp. JSM 1682029 TaxID=3229857 RepID=UPI00352528A8
MGAFLGAIGLVGFVAGIVLIILGFIKKKKYRGGIVTILSLILFIVGIVITPSVDYEVVEEETGSANTNTLSIRVTTESTKEKELELVAEEVKKEYEKKDVDGMWLYIHKKDNDKKFGDLMATANISYTFDGQVLVGNENPNDMSFEIK